MAETFGTKTLVELSRVIFVRLWGMLFIVAVVAGGTWYACQRAEKVYTSSVTLLAKQPQMRSPTVREVSADRSLEVFLRTQRELIMSDRVLLRVVMMLDEASLARRWQELAAEIGKEPGGLRAPRDLEGFLAEVDDAAEEKYTASGPAGEAFRKRFRRFGDGIEIATPGGAQVALSEVFTISAQHPGAPARAREAARLLAENYIERNREILAESSRRAAEFVQQRLGRLHEDSLAKAELAMADFVTSKLKTPADLVILEQLTKSGAEAAGQVVRTVFEQEKISLSAEIAEQEAKKQQIREHLPPDPPTAEEIDRDQKDLEAAQDDLARLEEIAARIAKRANDLMLVVPHQLATNSVVDNLKDQLAKLIVERNKLQVQYQGTYRELTDVHFEIIRTNMEIIRELGAEEMAIEAHVAALRARLADIEENVNNETQRLNEVSVLLGEYQQLQNNLLVARDQFKRMKDSLVDAQTAEEQQRNAISVTIVDDAELPDELRPTFPITWAYTLIATAAGLLLALAYAFLGDYFDHTIRTIHEAERYLGLPVVGSVRKAGRRLVT